jgi:dTDP-4-dehydrorhamnose reductase
LLITGASGLLGWNLCAAAMEHWDVYGVVFRHPVEIPGVRTIPVDLTDYSRLQSTFDKVRPEAVIHAAALSSPDSCQADPERSWSVNVEASYHVAGLCSDRRIPCVFTSTDLVFDGNCPPYRELDPVCPINVYGQHKVNAEQGMMERYPPVTICRMPLMFGEPGPASSSFLQPMLGAMRRGEELRLFIDEFRTPISAAAAARGLLLMLDSHPGIVHLSGGRRISRFDLGLLVREVFALSQARLVPCRRREARGGAPRPADVSLDNNKARSLGFAPPPLRTQLEELAGRSPELPPESS